MFIIIINIIIIIFIIFYYIYLYIPNILSKLNYNIKYQYSFKNIEYIFLKKIKIYIN